MHSVAFRVIVQKGVMAFRVIVQKISGKTIVIQDCNEDMTVAQIKKISAITGIPHPHQKLHLGLRRVQDENTLAKEQIVADTVLSLVVDDSDNDSLPSLVCSSDSEAGRPTSVSSSSSSSRWAVDVTYFHLLCVREGVSAAAST